MRVDLSYLGRSEVRSAADGLELSLSPNLSRGRVFFDGRVKDPIRYREAMSALHDVVVSDLRYKKRSGSAAYLAYLEAQKQEEAALSQQVRAETKAEALSRQPKVPPKDLEKRFRAMHQKYWKARREWANELQRTDPEMWRALVPCDPVITVAPDVVFFEGFAKDESAYGCLLIDRDAFEPGAAEGLGTTNVDYSMALYESIQTLRTYRPTRLTVDPHGFDVKVEGLPEHREEKIDLPGSWLKGFGQITAAMMLPSRTVRLDVPAVYAVLSFLRRNKEKQGPRSLSFQLRPGQTPKLLLEPWGLTVDGGLRYDGPAEETIKVWGRRRLMALSRLLPLADHVEVRLLGTGLPSIWTVVMPGARFILGLSGWTTNDWSKGAALDLLGGLDAPDPLTTARIAEHLQKERLVKPGNLAMTLGLDPQKVGASLFLLAKQGQVIFDFAHGVHRYRPILPVAMTPELLGPDHPELVGAREIIAHKGGAAVSRDEAVGKLRLVVGKVGDRTDVELAMDADGIIKQGRCDCSYFYTSKLRKGPCRHLLVLRTTVLEGLRPSAKTGRWGWS